MDRRSFLARSVVGISMAAALPAPAISQGRRELKMVTSWPTAMVGVSTSAERIARSIAELTAGRLTVTVFGAGELVSAFEVFDAVSSGVADMYHSAEYYWDKHSPAFPFFASVPFGFTANELSAWVHFGGGQELWDELSSGFSIKPLLTAATGVQMGGWFAKEVSGPESYKGLRYRMPGIGGEVLRRLGAIVVPLSGGEIVPALQSGAIDASEWVGPWNDMDLGLHKASRYYYYPGFHEPGNGITTGVNLAVWEQLSDDDRNLIAQITRAEYTHSLAEFNTNNARALEELSRDPSIEIRRFDDSLLQAIGKASGEVMSEIGSRDQLTRRVYESYVAFRSRIKRWSDVSERGFLNARALDFPYGMKG